MARPLDIDFSPLDAHPRGDLVVALSGGLDSSALLHALATCSEARSCNLRAVHVHHGLHAAADAWQVHCERFCAALDVPLSCRRVDVERIGDGPEAAARRARYAAFAEVLADGDILVLAHHRDDQAETFLLRALRASGPDGLRAMPPWRAFGTAWLWRPLLGVSRARLGEYALANGLDWIDDPSNVDASFDRNFLRTHVLPVLRERWPLADAAFARSAALCADAADLLDHDDDALLAGVTLERHVLDAAKLARLPAARRSRLLRRWIALLGLPPLPAEGIRRIEAELLTVRRDATARLDWHGATVRAWCGQLHAGRASAPLDAALDLPWSGVERLQLPHGSSLSITPPIELPSTVRVRARRGGERIRLPGRTHSHALKHVLQDARVPPWTREHLPLLVDGDEVLAAGDVAVSARMADLLATAGATLAWSRPIGT